MYHFDRKEFSRSLTPVSNYFSMFYLFRIRRSYTKIFLEFKQSRTFATLLNIFDCVSIVQHTKVFFLNSWQTQNLFSSDDHVSYVNSSDSIL